MPKMIKNCFCSKLNFTNIYNAYFRTKKNKAYEREVLKFENNLEVNIIKIIKKLKDNTYKRGNYYSFKVYEPKERVIQALPFKDRIIQQWLVNEFLMPFIVPRFIYDSYACIKNKGTHQAVDRLQYFMNKMRKVNNNFYVINMDIHKFFYSIDQNILISILKKYIKDERLLVLCEIFIRNNNIGIPIGNYTSQYFANIYLNELDYYVKYDLKIKYYLRYMDDFILLVKSKEEAKIIYKKIEYFINNNLNLELNPKSSIYPNKMGINFCGYRIFINYRLVRNRNKKEIKKKIKRWNKLYLDNNLDLNKVILSFNSWKAHIKHANSYNLYNKYYNKIIFKELL